jgi:hypothetical protein
VGLLTARSGAETDWEIPAYLRARTPERSRRLKCYKT